ncbi:MAG: hypothetical protein R2843_10855 [Thermomicrobiales bacterium]
MRVRGEDVLERVFVAEGDAGLAPTAAMLRRVNPPQSACSLVRDGDEDIDLPG